MSGAPVDPPASGADRPGQLNQTVEMEGVLAQARRITQHGMLGTVHNNSGWIGNTVHGGVLILNNFSGSAADLLQAEQPPRSGNAAHMPSR